MSGPPPRTLSAHGKDQPLFHTADPAGISRASGGATLAGTFALLEVSPAPNTATRSPGENDKQPVSPSQEDSAPLPPPPTPMIEDKEFDDDDDDPEQFEEGVYGNSYMMNINSTALWGRVPEADRAAQPTSALWGREDGKISEKQQPTSAKEGTMHHHNFRILGILTKVTSENYVRMERELLDLPIRQATKEQIEDLVRTIYCKSIRPEEAPYVELYMKLLVALVNHCGKTGVGKTIRRAIVENCQQQFEGCKLVLEPEDTVSPDGTPLSPEEIEGKKYTLKDKLRANITILGLLFINHLLQEKVVNFVLYLLMYGDQSRHRRNDGRHKPDDYEVEMFCELFKQVGPHLTAKTLEGEQWPSYLANMKKMSTTTGSTRIRFILMNTLEVYHSGWKSKEVESVSVPLVGSSRRRRKRVVPDSSGCESTLQPPPPHDRSSDYRPTGGILLKFRSSTKLALL